MEVATRRRLQEELGISVELEYVYQFRYQAIYNDEGAEHELCSVYLGRTDHAIKANSTEIDAIRFLSPDQLRQEIENNPAVFTPWFKQEWDRLTSDFAGVLATYSEAA